MAALRTNQAGFDAWANTVGRKMHTFIFLLMVFMIAACTSAIAIMGPRLVREGSLLWFGTRTDGAIERATVVRVGAFKGGDPKYQLTLSYHFTATDGVSYAGTTIRGDVRNPPVLEPGDPIGVYFEQANPLNSVAEHNLRTDVYALVLFLPFLAVVGIAFPLWYLRGWWRWRRNRAAAAA